MPILTDMGGSLYHPDISCAWDILQGVLGPAERKIGPFRDRIWIDSSELELYAEQTDFCSPMEYRFRIRLLTRALTPSKIADAIVRSADRQNCMYLFRYSEYDDNDKLIAEAEFESPDFEARYKAMLAQHGPRPG